MREAYAIIKGDTMHELVKNVHVLTEEGFEPVGAPFHAAGDFGLCWHQAMYKRPVEDISIDTSFDGSKVTWLPVDINGGKDA